MDTQYQPTHTWTCNDRHFCHDNGLPVAEPIPVSILGAPTGDSIVNVVLKTGQVMQALSYELQEVR